MLNQVSKSVENNTGRKQEENNGDPRNACFEEVMSSLENEISRGNIYSLKAVWTYFCSKTAV